MNSLQHFHGMELPPALLAYGFDVAIPLGGVPAPEPAPAPESEPEVSDDSPLTYVAGRLRGLSEAQLRAVSLALDQIEDGFELEPDPSPEPAPEPGPSPDHGVR